MGAHHRRIERLRRGVRPPICEQGHSLVLVARRLDRLQALAEALRRQYRIDVVVDEVDLSDVAAVIQLHRHLREQGIAIDILINNAGHGLQGPFVEYAAKFCTPW